MGLFRNKFFLLVGFIRLPLALTLKTMVCLLVLSSLFFCRNIVKADEIVLIKDSNLAATIRQSLGLGPYDTITLSDMSNLRTLNSRSGIGPIYNLTGLEKAVNLQTLGLANEPISDLSPISKLTSLKTVSLSFKANSPLESLSPLSGLINLEKLDITWEKPYDLSFIQNLTKLKVLSIFNNGNGTYGDQEFRDISILKNLHDLEELDLIGHQIDDLTPLTNLINLKKLYLGGNNIKDISPLKSLTNLKELDLGGGEFTDISVLSSLTQLEMFGLEEVKVTDISSLEKLYHLTSINISGTKITSIKPIINNFMNRPVFPLDPNISPDIMLNDNELNVHDPAVLQDIETLGRLFGQRFGSQSPYYIFPQHSVLQKPILEGDTKISARSGVLNSTWFEVYKVVDGGVNNLLISRGKPALDANGMFSFTIPPQRAGTSIIIREYDNDRASANTETTFVVQPSTTPDVTTVSEPTITNLQLLGSSLLVEGYADPLSEIRVKEGANWIARPTSDDKGYFQFYIPYPGVGTVYEITAGKDTKFGDQIYSNTINFRYIGKEPKIHPISNLDQTITGTTESRESSVIASIGNKKYTGKVNSDGTFSVHIDRQKAGTVISLNLYNENELNEAAQITVKDLPPQITGVSSNHVYNQDKIITFNEGTATLNGKPFKSRMKVTKDGNYTLVVTDEANNQTKVVFTIDKTAPVVSGIKNNGLFKTDVIPGFNEGKATIDGKTYVKGTKITKEGRHMFIVKDTAGNTTSIVFTIDKTAPVVSGIKNNGLYKVNVIPVFHEGKATIDGKTYVKGTKITKEGRHTFSVKDVAGNTKTVVFTIDKTPPRSVTVKKVKSSSRSLSGKAEKGANIYVYKGKVRIGHISVKSNGTYSLKITKQRKGVTLTVYAVDKAGNKSKAKKVKVS